MGFGRMIGRERCFPHRNVSAVGCGVREDEACVAELVSEVILFLEVLTDPRQNGLGQKSPEQVVMTFGQVMRAGEQAVDELKFMLGADLHIGEAAETNARAFEGADNRGAGRDHATAPGSSQSNGLQCCRGDVEFFGERQGSVDLRITRGR